MAVGSPGARHRASLPRSSSSAKSATDTAAPASDTTEGSSPIEHVIERVARHYGISRDRVAARLIEECFMEWMVEESEKIWNDPSQAKFCERIGPKVIRLLKRCRTGEAVEARDAEKLIR